MTNNVLKATLAVVSIVAIVMTSTLIYRVVQDNKTRGENGHPLESTTVAETTATTSTVPVTTTRSEVTDTTPTTTTTEATPTSCAGTSFPYHNIRLPVYLRPSSYLIKLDVDLEKNFDFHGSVKVTFATSEPTDFIVIHSKNLNMSNYEVRSEDGKVKVDVVKEVYCPDTEQLYLGLKDGLEVNKNYTLSIDFHAGLSVALAGFYKSSYTNGAGETKWLATTQFEAIDARSAFPCFDEPNMKASFRLVITRNKDLRTLFNTPMESTSKMADDRVEDTYTESPRMSTYLVAFIVCDFSVISDHTSRGVKVSVSAPKNQIGQAKFALECAVIVLDYYEQFFGIDYPMKKLDLVAVPDFPIGAMENWGLITYRLTAILYDEKISSAYNKQRVATVIAHEIAHQWFGNLVTMDWWNDLWLNEGFASFMEYLGTDKINKNFKVIDQFIPMDLTAALSADSMKSSHPVSVKIDDPAEVNSLFDTISYEKGSSIVRMMESFVGNVTLSRSLTAYLKKFEYRNAVTNDLWDSLSQKGNSMDVKKVMQTWTEQMNYPLVTLTRSYDNSRVVATQERYLQSEAGAEGKYKSPFGYKWYVPLTCIDSVNKDSFVNLHWMNLSSVEFKVDPRAKWIKANHDMKGYYRVQYSMENWRALIHQLKEDHLELTEADRANLIDDSFALSGAGKLDIELPLDLSLYLNKDMAYVPWRVALNQLWEMESQLSLSEAYPYYKAYMLMLLKNNIESLKWEDGGSHMTKFRRSMIFDVAVRLGHKDSIAKATQLFSAMVDNNELVIPDLKNPVYRAAIQYGGQKEFDVLWKALKDTNVPSEQRIIMRALATSTDPAIITKYLTLSIEENSPIRKGDVKHVVSYVSYNPMARDTLWKFVKKNWDALIAFYGSSYGMPGIIMASGQHFATLAELRELKAFYKVHTLASGKNAIAKTYEQVRINIAWKKDHYPRILDWLKP